MTFNIDFMQNAYMFAQMTQFWNDVFPHIYF